MVINHLLTGVILQVDAMAITISLLPASQYPLNLMATWWCCYHHFTARSIYVVKLQIFCIFNPNLGEILPFWLIFFKWVETSKWWFQLFPCVHLRLICSEGWLNHHRYVVVGKRTTLLKRNIMFQKNDHSGPRGLYSSCYPVISTEGMIQLLFRRMAQPPPSLLKFNY